MSFNFKQTSIQPVDELGVLLQTLPLCQGKLPSLPLSPVVPVTLTFRGTLWDLSISLSRP